MPAVAAVRETYPSAHVTLLTLPYTGELATLYGLADDVITVDTNRIRTLRGLLSGATWKEYAQVVAALRRSHFDVAISLSGRMASLWAALSGAASVVGYASEAYAFLLTEAIPGRRYLQRKHESEYCLALTAAIGARAPASNPRPTIPSSTQREADSILRSRGLEPGSRYVVLHTGAGNGTAKLWPLSYWARLLPYLRIRKLAPVIVGSASDARTVDDLMGMTAEKFVSVVGDTSTAQLAAVLQSARIVISSDSGPLHLASSLGRPVIGLYGPTDPITYGPPESTGAVVLRHDLACSPCYTARNPADCPLGHNVCMDLLEPRRVVRALDRLLDVATP